VGLQFEWDEKKAKINKRKHGITFEEYDFSNGVRGKYAKSVNEALRTLINLMNNT